MLRVAFISCSWNWSKASDKRWCKLYLTSSSLTNRWNWGVSILAWERKCYSTISNQCILMHSWQWLKFKSFELIIFNYIDWVSNIAYKHSLAEDQPETNLDNFAICGWIFSKFAAYVHIVLLIGLLMVMGLESDCGATCEQFHELT